MARRYVQAGCASAIFLITILCPVWTGSHAAEDARPGGISAEVSPAAAGLLKQLNTASAQTLQGPMGLPEGMVAKIMAHRAAGGKFENLIQVRKVTGMSSGELTKILGPFEKTEAAHAFESQRKPVPEPAESGKAGGKLQRGEAAEPEKGAASAAAGGETAASGTGPITMVRPGFYGKLPGFDDLDKIDPIKRTEFLETVNREMCTCGCKNETLAFCLVNDPTCPIVKSRVKKIYDDILHKPAN